MLDKIKLQQLLREVILRDRVILKPRGGIVELLLNPQLTKYNANDFIKESNKSRRPKKTDNKDKSFLQYCMVGKCMAFHKRGIDSSFTLRNVVSLCPFEMTYSLFTSYITAFVIRDLFKKSRRIHYKRSSHYEYRKISPHRTRIDFEYVIDKTYDDNNN